MTITTYLHEEEFYAPFIKVEGERGTVLIFRDVPNSPVPQASLKEMKLAVEIETVLRG